MRNHAWPLLALTLLGLAFFAPLLAHPDGVLYSDWSDVYAEHVPAKRFLVRAYQETGEIPLWCPLQFAGSPFVHDLQVAIFYPFHLPLLLLPEGAVANALSWLVVLHVLLAGWLMYGYARWQGLSAAGATVAAAGYMFAGKWLAHLLVAGHYITLGLGWLPAVVWLLEWAVRRRSVGAAAWAGACFALVVLSTHPQWILYGGVLIALWTYPAAEVAGASPPERRWWLGRWAGMGLVAGAVAVAAAAVQLLPTVEASRGTSRAAGLAGTDSIAGGLRSFLCLVGPALHDGTPGAQPNQQWEDRGAFGVAWLVAAACAPVVTADRRRRWQAIAALILFVFAFGGSAFVERLPGFSYFRQPSRMLLLTTFPVAFLAGVTTDALRAGLTAGQWARCREVLYRVLGLAVLTLGLVAAAVLVGGNLGGFLGAEGFRSHPYWWSLLVTMPALLWLFHGGAGRRGAAWVWPAVLIVDLWAVAWPWVVVKDEADVYPPSRLVSFLAEHRFGPDGPGRVLDRDSHWDPTGATPLGPGSPLALIHGIESLRGYNPLDVLRYKEYLQFLGDLDEPLKGVGGRLTMPVLSDFPTRDWEAMHRLGLVVRNKPLLDLLNVRYLAVPRTWRFSAPDKAYLGVGLAGQLADPVGGPWGALVAAYPHRLNQAGWRRVETDPEPVAFNFFTGGTQRLHAYDVFENTTALPRAFVVPQAVHAGDRAHVLEDLKAADFRRTVIVENFPGTFSLGKPPPPPLESFRPVRVAAYQPNRITLNLEGGPGGWLVLSEVWYPGWTCRVDGQAVPVYRGNFLFRTVPIPDGAREVVFTMEPASYWWGLRITWATVAALVVGTGVGWVRRARRA